MGAGQGEQQGDSWRGSSPQNVALGAHCGCMGGLVEDQVLENLRGLGPGGTRHGRRAGFLTLGSIESLL